VSPVRSTVDAGTLRDARQQRLDGLHRGRRADNRIEGVLAALAGSERPHLAAKLGRLERLLDEHDDFIEIKRLVNVMVGAELHGFDGVLDRRERGDHDHLRLRRELFHPSEDGEAVAIGQLEVEEHEIDFGRREPLERLRREPGFDHVVVLGGQPLTQRPAHERFIVNDQDLR
jgi:hypothetical protein